MCRTILIAILWTVFVALPVSGTTIYVPDDYPLIIDAMVFATYGDTVLVRCGVYYESNIPMKNGVTLVSETGEVGCARIDAQNLGRIIDCTDCDENTAIVGFTLASGFVTGASDYGAGIRCTRSSPRLENLRFIFCQVRSTTGLGGGGVGCLDSSPTLTNVEFDGCVLQWSTTHGGGAMVTLGQSSPTLNAVVFDMNWTTDSWGGALSVEGYGGQVVTLNDVTFTDNDSPTTGGALHVSGSTTVIDGAVFHDNWAHEGGAIHLATCRPCTFSNVTFTRNTAAYGKGGGLYCQTTPDGTLTMTNVRFFDNTAATGGGGMACAASTMPTISYATFAGNSAVTGGGLDVAGGPIKIDHATFCANEASGSGGGIHVDAASSLDLETSIVAFSTDGEGISVSGFTPPSISCTDIYGNADGDWVGILAPLEGVNGNFRLDPLFCDAANSDFTLAADSPCLPANNSCAELIGAHGEGCPPSTGVSEGAQSVLAVHPAAPNPFGQRTALSYELPSDGTVGVRVFDVSGKLVRTLVDSEHQSAGLKTIVWNGRDDSGRPVASGVYFFRVDAGEESIERRAVLLR